MKIMEKKIIYLLVAILSLVSCKKEHQDSNSHSDKESVEELTKTVYEIWQDANDRNREKLKSAHFNDPKFSKFGPRIPKRQNVEETNNSETEHFTAISNAVLKIEDLKVDIFNDVGIATFYNNFSFEKNKQNLSGKGRVTLVFLKTTKGWKIIHEHSSPFQE